MRPDGEDLRLCRIALVALVPADAVLTVTRQGVIVRSGEPRRARVEYRAAIAGTPDRSGFAECLFSGGAAAASPDTLIGLSSDEGTLSPARLLFLRRFWLDTPEGERSDPQPVSGLAMVPALPAWAAYAVQQLFNALPTMAIYGLLAASYALVYGLVGRINLAFGEFAAVGGAAGLTGLGFVNDPGLASMIVVTVLAGAYAATMHGVVIAKIVFAPLRHATRLNGLVATLGLALVLNEYLRLAQGPTPRWITPLRSFPVAVAHSHDFAVTVTPLNLAVACTFALAALIVLGLMARSQFGRNWRAIADDPDAAALMGVDPNRTFALTFALASALAGLAGAVTVLVYGSFGTSFGATLGLKALLAAILGGIGSVSGAFLGGMAISLIEAVWSTFFPIEYRDLALFVVLVIALVARPGGLFGFADLAPRRV